MKKCYKCQKQKKHSNFYKNRAKSDGLQTMCKKCSSKRVRSLYANSIVKVTKKTKKCLLCKKIRRVSRFGRNKLASDGLQSICNPCTNEKARKYAREHHLHTRYGLTIDDYNKMLSNQKGVCKICKALPTTSSNNKLAVDHCHISGDVRGLLCTRCNVVIGQIENIAHLYDKINDYLGHRVFIQRSYYV